MSGLSRTEQVWLKEKFGDFVNLDRNERVLYSHDIAAMPGLFKPLIGNTIPDAVVQPQSESMLQELVKWAVSHKIPVTPRGKASSGYGGVLPTRKGIVIDFYRMKKVLKMDTATKTVTVEPGITWEQLDRVINSHGLALRLYPSSYPGSSVGGWLAQGGAGFGSYEYGWFADNVVSAKIVLPDGEIREFSDRDLELVADAEGITGIISEVTLQLQPLADIEVLACSFPTAEDFKNAMKTCVAKNLPIWSVIFINPTMARLKNQAPRMEHHGHPVGDKPVLPEAYIATIAFKKENQHQILDQALEIVKQNHGERLSQEIADHEWSERFKLMMVKRLGPSLIPAEVVVPLETFDKVMLEIEKKVNKPVVKEGVVIKKGRNGQPEIVILGFIPADQRKFSYNFAFGLTLTIFKIAEKYGGRAYSTGLYFSSKIHDILGKERTNRLKAFKKEIDPNGLLNPDKVLGGKFIGRLMGIANLLEPFARPLGNLVRAEIGERPLTRTIRDIPGDVAWHAYACSQCGYCVDECDQFYGRGWESQSPRGKWYWLREYLEGRAKWNQKVVDTFIVCTTCELCNLRCSAALPIEQSWMKLRGKLIHEKKEMTFPPFEMMSAALRAEGNIWAGYRKNRMEWFP